MRAGIDTLEAYSWERLAARFEQQAGGIPAHPLAVRKRAPWPRAGECKTRVPEDGAIPLSGDKKPDDIGRRVPST